MTLKEYHRDYGVRFSHIARLSGISAWRLALIREEKSYASITEAIKIEEATKYAVPATNWYTQEEIEQARHLVQRDGQ